MKRHPVTSSVIASVGYDPSTRMMEVEFKTGRVYQYFMVPANIHGRLMSARSIGHYFNTEIRDNFEYLET